MKLTTIAALTLTGLITGAFTVDALAQYRWTDENGRTVFSDKPPPRNAKNAKRVNTDGSTGSDTLPGPSNLPYEVRLNMRDHPVTLYTNGGDCAGCADARKALTSRGVPFAEKIITNDFDLVAFQKVNPGSVIPTVTVGSVMISGFNPAAMTGALDAAGYPATSRLPSSYRNPAAQRVNPTDTPVPQAASAPASK